jgi:hypothetical protein
VPHADPVPALIAVGWKVVTPGCAFLSASQQSVLLATYPAGIDPQPIAVVAGSP